MEVKEKTVNAAESSASIVDAIKADPELMALLEQRPELLAELERKIEHIDGLERRAQAYLAGDFDQLLSLLILLEVPYDPETGKPAITAGGVYSFPHADKTGRIVLERFFSWQRIWHLWPHLEHRISTHATLSEQEKKLRLSAIKLVRAMLEEGEIVAGAA